MELGIGVSRSICCGGCDGETEGFGARSLVRGRSETGAPKEGGADGGGIDIGAPKEGGADGGGIDIGAPKDDGGGIDIGSGEASSIEIGTFEISVVSSCLSEMGGGTEVATSSSSYSADAASRSSIDTTGGYNEADSSTSMAGAWLLAARGAKSLNETAGSEVAGFTDAGTRSLAGARNEGGGALRGRADAGRDDRCGGAGGLDDATAGGKGLLRSEICGKGLRRLCLTGGTEVGPAGIESSSGNAGRLSTAAASGAWDS